MTMFLLLDGFGAALLCCWPRNMLLDPALARLRLALRYATAKPRSKIDVARAKW